MKTIEDLLLPSFLQLNEENCRQAIERDSWRDDYNLNHAGVEQEEISIIRARMMVIILSLEPSGRGEEGKKSLKWLRQ